MQIPGNSRENGNGKSWERNPSWKRVAEISKRLVLVWGKLKWSYIWQHCTQFAWHTSALCVLRYAPRMTILLPRVHFLMRAPKRPWRHGHPNYIWDILTDRWFSADDWTLVVGGPLNHFREHLSNKPSFINHLVKQRLHYHWTASRAWSGAREGE